MGGVLQIQAVFPDGGAVVINRFGDQSYIVWARAEGNGAFRLLARPFQHQGDPLSTKTFKVSGFTKAMKALHLPERQISDIRKNLESSGELLVGGSVRGANR